MHLKKDRGCIAGQGVGIQIIIPAFLNSCLQLYPIGKRRFFFVNIIFCRHCVTFVSFLGFY